MIKKSGTYVRIITLIFIFAIPIPPPASAVDPEGTGPKRIERIYLAQNGKLTPKQKKSFEQLPPDEQKRIRENYRKFQEMQPSQRQKLNQRFEKFQQLSPWQQNQLRENYKKLKKNSPQKPSPSPGKNARRNK